MSRKPLIAGNWKLNHLTGAAVAVFFVAAACADAVEVRRSYFASSTPQNVALPSGSHTFVIDNIPPLNTTKWYVNSSLRETDKSTALAIPPRLTVNLSPGEHWVYALIENSVGYATISHFSGWTVRVGLPDLRIAQMSVEPAVPVAGETYVIRILVENIGGLKASAGPLTDQEAHFYVHNDLWDSADYDNVSSFDSPILVQSRPLSAGPPRDRTLLAVVDANHEVEESNENNNSKSMTITIRGADWIQVPNVVGYSQSAAQDALTNAGFTSQDVLTSYSDSAPMDAVMFQSPAAGKWAAPSTTITLLVSLGPGCEVAVLKPGLDDALEIGTRTKIKWESTGPCCDEVRIELWQSGQKVDNIKKATANDGKVGWNIKPSKYAAGTGYEVRLYCEDKLYGMSSTFSLVEP